MSTVCNQNEKKKNWKDHWRSEKTQSWDKVRQVTFRSHVCLSSLSILRASGLRWNKLLEKKKLRFLIAYGYIMLSVSSFFIKQYCVLWVMCRCREGTRPWKWAKFTVSLRLFSFFSCCTFFCFLLILKVCLWDVYFYDYSGCLVKCFINEWGCNLNGSRDVQ